MPPTRAKRKTDSKGEPVESRDKQLLLRIFETMVMTRAVEDRMVSMYRSGDLLGSLYTGHWHEAISPTGGRDGTLHYGRLDLNIYNLPSHIPDNYPVALGFAFAFQYRDQDGVSLAYCGDGSTSEGNFHESLNIAAAMKLPAIFIVENNQYAYSTPVRMQSAVKEYSVKAQAYGMPGVTVDGTDVLAVHDATSEAVARARAGEGPSLIEGVTMRMHGHAEHDPADYVPREMLEEWQKRDPVALFESVLLEHGIIDEETASKTREAARQKAIEARKKALADPLPDPATVEQGVYAD